MPTRQRRKPATRKINIALQGGGSHGAFAWGVLDRLLEDERLTIDGIVGTSAGAMNAAVTAYGLATGGAQGAKAKLREFWTSVSEAARYSPLQPCFMPQTGSRGSLQSSPAYQAIDMMSRYLSPYQLNPLNQNPLRDVLARVVDFDVLRRARNVRMFTSATNVRSGRIKVFPCSEATVDTVLASACLPLIFQAVEIDGEHYWDGGYMGNPPIYPLIYHCDSRDVVLVMINPIVIDDVPTDARAIVDRINTLSFNSSLMREMRAINFVSKLIDGGFDDRGRLRRMLLHCIDAEEEMRKLDVSSKVNASWDFISFLHELGRQRAEAFLSAHYDKLGRTSSTSIEERFL
jgi:NTE family protein